MKILVKLKNIIKTKIKFPTIQKFIGVLILFSIALTIFAPLGAVATHTKNSKHDLHAEGSFSILTPEEFDKMSAEVRRDVNAANIGEYIQITILGIPVTDGIYIGKGPEALNEAYVEAMQKISKLSPDALLKYANRKNNAPTHENPTNNVDSVCDYTVFPSIECLVTRGIGWVSYVVLQGVSYLLFISAKIFDLSARLSLDYRAYSAKTAVPVYLGWRAARDFVNILFIFIILIIALALILQVQQYYSRQVLVKLVGVALFINFSFFLCQQIINFTNSAAIYFKDRIVGCESDKCWNNWELSKIFVTELNPQQMLNNYTVEVPPLQDSDTTGTQAQYAEFNKTIEKSPGIIAMIIATFGGIVIMLAASFVLLTAAGMFLLRLVMLWNIIILAPIAITASILPVTQRHFSAWWQRFTREAFFAPAMMFMFYIEMSILKQGFLRDFVKGNAPSDANVFGSLGTTFTFNFYLIAIYILMMMLFVKALFVARSMSAQGADAVWRGGKKAIKRVTGQHGKKPLYAMGRGVRSAAAPTAEKILTTENKALGRFYKMTGLRKGATEIVTRTKGDIEKAKSGQSKFSSKELASKFKNSFGSTSTSENMATLQLLQERDDLNMVGPEYLKKAHKRLSNLGISTKSIETYIPSLSKDDSAREKAVQRQQADKTSDYLQIADEFDYTKNPKNRDLQLKTWGDGHLKEMFKSVSAADPSDTKILPQAKNLLQGYVDKYGASMDNIVSGLEKDNNNSAARFLKTAEGERMFQKMAEKTGAAKPMRGTYAAKAQAKEDLQLEDRELVNNVMLDKDGKLDKTDEGKERIFEVVRQMDDKQLSDILATLQTLADTERTELLAMTTTKDKEKGANEAKRIVNINPTIIKNADQNTKNDLGLQDIKQVVNQIPIRDARYLQHEALIDPEVITALSHSQLSDIAENNKKLTNKEKEEIIRVLITEDRGTNDVKNYMNSSSFWNPAAGRRGRQNRPGREFNEGGGI